MLTMDGTREVDYFHFNGQQSSTVSLDLTAGQRHDFMFELLDGGGDAHLKVEWESPSQPR